MTHRIETVTDTETVRQAYEKALDNGQRALPVLNQQRELIGIITQTDFSRALENDEADRPVSQFATLNPFATYPEQSLSEVVLRFSQVNQIPVVDRRNRRRLLGMLTRKDLMKVRGTEVTKPADD